MMRGNLLIRFIIFTVGGLVLEQTLPRAEVVAVERVLVPMEQLEREATPVLLGQGIVFRLLVK
jgi:hypothetical protein